MYRVPALDSAAWKPAEKLPPVERLIGADPEQGLVFMLDRKNSVVALDLDTRRVRTYLENVRHATLGPDGALYAVDTGSTVIQLVRRTPVRFRSKLQGKPAELHGTMDGALVARFGRKQAGARIPRVRSGADIDPTPRGTGCGHASSVT